MGYQYRQSWENKSFDLATGKAPTYYVVKNKENWEAVAGTLKDSNGKTIVTPKDKGTLSEVLSFIGINVNDVRMVAQGNTKFLDALGSKNIADVINDKKISIDIEKVKMVKSLDNRMVREIVKDKKFQTLSDENTFKKMILEWHQALKDVVKIEPIIKFIRVDEKYVLTFPSKMVEMMYHACGSWQCGISKVVDALLEQEQIS
jgi:ribosomal protein L12E/L44/L45/RPP1/RPP2